MSKIFGEPHLKYGPVRVYWIYVCCLQFDGWESGNMYRHVASSAPATRRCAGQVLLGQRARHHPAVPSLRPQAALPLPVPRVCARQSLAPVLRRRPGPRDARPGSAEVAGRVACGVRLFADIFNRAM